MGRYPNSPSSSSYSLYYEEYRQYLSLPLHLVLFLAIIFIFFFFSWYIHYDYIFWDLMDQLKLCLMILPVLLLLMVHWLAEDREHFPFPVSFSSPEKDSLHRLGGSPVGVALLLVFLIILIPHHTSLHHHWFPLFARPRY